MQVSLYANQAGLGAVDLSNPQTLNRYVYVGNNPLSNTDPSGLLQSCPSGDGCQLSTTQFLVFTTCEQASLAYPGQITCGANQFATDLRAQNGGSASGGGGATNGRFTVVQLIGSAMKQKRIGACSAALFGNPRALTSRNSPTLRLVTPQQIKSITGQADSGGTYDYATRQVLFNTEIFYSKTIPFVFFQSNYLHEAGNLISMRLYGNALARGGRFAGQGEMPFDPDSGASFERCIFGQRMQIP